MLKAIFENAFMGQRLAQWTLLFVVQIIIYPILSDSSKHICNLFLVLTASINLCGWAFLIVLYRHSIRVIFNRKLPTRTSTLPSFTVHFAMLRPLEIIFRYVTLRFRVLPDILVLGEVRCGTTTLCQHLASTYGCHPPFCLWRHPELDKKETFYFVGHYLGMVDPTKYRMCFPLALTKWFHQMVLKRPFFTFDGCAQYLTSPTAPYLIAKAYKDAGQPPPILVACIRNPLDQALSWWTYENNAMLWGNKMGLTEWNTQLRTAAYPPQTISRALAFSLSDEVQQMYADAEELFSTKNENASICYLPNWAITWPAGQLSGIGRNGCFASNIQRYERIFGESFGSSAGITMHLKSSLRFINIIPLDILAGDDLLCSSMQRLLDCLNLRTRCKEHITFSEQQMHFGIRRNAGTKLSNVAMVPTIEEIATLKQFFANDTKELEKLYGNAFAWSS